MATKKKAKKKAPTSKTKAKLVTKKKKKAAAPARPKKARLKKRTVARKAGRAAAKPAPKARSRKTPARGVKSAAKAVNSAPEKAGKKAAVGKPRAAPLRRRDGTGHLDPKYAADLRAEGGHAEPATASFLDRPRSGDALVEELGEQVVESATSAEYEAEETLNQEVDEERGGPFVETSGAEEFGHDVDASNPKGAKREPFPTT